LNKWGRKSLIGCVVLAVTAVSLIGSPEVPGKVMQFAAFDLWGADLPTHEEICDDYRRAPSLQLNFYGCRQ